MSHLLVLLAALALVALLTELVAVTARDLLEGKRKVEAMEGSIDRAEGELRVAEKKLDQSRAKQRSLTGELEGVRSLLDQVETELRKAPDPECVLVHTIGSVRGQGPRFRARILKDLPAEAEQEQLLLWSYIAVVELEAPDRAAALKEARRHYPPSAGYQIGSIDRVDSLESVA